MGNKKTDIKLTYFFHPIPGSNSVLYSRLLYLQNSAVVWGVFGEYGQHVVVSLCCYFPLTPFLCFPLRWRFLWEYPSAWSFPWAAGDICSTTMECFILLLWSWYSLCYFSLFLFSPHLSIEHFLPFLKYVLTEVPCTWPCIGSILEPARPNCVQRRAAPGLFSQLSSFLALQIHVKTFSHCSSRQRPPLHSPHYQNLVMYSQYTKKEITTSEKQIK